jgi:hypothetical protein
VGAIADPFHCNSIDIRNGKILLSMRHTDSVYVLDEYSGQVLSKIGGNIWNGVSLRNQVAPATQDVTSGQHNAQWVTDNQISVFDDETLEALPARGLLISLNTKVKSFRILRKFEDPSGANSYCTGSFGKTQTSPTYWIADWGCSPSGLTVFSDYGTPIVSIRISDSVANQSILAATLPFLKYQLGYRARIVNNP